MPLLFPLTPPLLLTLGYSGSSSGGGSGGYADYYALIPNRSAFADLLCDLEVWTDSPGDLLRSLFEHFSELLAGEFLTLFRTNSSTSFRLFSGLFFSARRVFLNTNRKQQASPLSHRRKCCYF